MVSVSCILIAGIPSVEGIRIPLMDKVRDSCSPLDG